MDRSEHRADAGVKTPQWTIVGQGLAGTCLAWEFWKRGVDFKLLDREQGGSSRVAAGLVNPVTGKNFEPSRRIAEFLPEALGFYQMIGNTLERKLWHPFPVLRLADSDKEWEKILSKTSQPDVAPWILSGAISANGWRGAIEVGGGGRLDTRTFLDQSRGFFRAAQIYQKSEFVPGDEDPFTILCEGATGLIRGACGPHRCAKGEILTVRATGWDESRIRVGAGGWMVPLGDGQFKAGSTYEWNQLDETPTEAGKQRVMEIIGRLGGGDFEILDHEAGIRPILRRSEPLIGPTGNGGWMFNGLGSKGSLYAPGMARKLCGWLLDGIEPEPEVDYRNFRHSTG